MKPNITKVSVNIRRTISVDTGNGLIKTINHVFHAGYIENIFLPGIGSDVLTFRGKTYTLADESMPVLNDKTVDERYYILTLFALGKELKGDKEILKLLAENEVIEVDLLVGLPLLHYELHKKKFQQYFCNPSVPTVPTVFELNGKEFRVSIKSANVFPQGFAAAMTVFGQLKQSKIVNIVDVGGFTVDCIQLKNLNPNMSLCTSLYFGVRELFDKINDQARALGKKDIAEDVIRDILMEEHPDYSQERIDIVRNAACAFADRLLEVIAGKGFDIEEEKTVFMGGGAILLEDYFLTSGRAKKPLFIGDVHANAKGYALLHNLKNKSNNDSSDKLNSNANSSSNGSVSCNENSDGAKRQMA